MQLMRKKQEHSMLNNILKPIIILRADYISNIIRILLLLYILYYKKRYWTKIFI